MHSLAEISAHLERVKKKLGAMLGNTRIYTQSRLLMSKQSRFEHRRKNADLNEHQEFQQALKRVKTSNKQELEVLRRHASMLREELMTLQSWVDILEQAEDIDADDCKDQIYTCLLSLAENWPLNLRRNKNLLCPITGNEIKKNPILLSNGYQYSKDGLRQHLEGRAYFPRQLPGSDFSIVEIDIENVTACLSVAEKFSSEAFKIGYIAGAIPGLGLLALSAAALLTSLVFPPAAAVVLPLFLMGVVVSLGASLLCGALFAGFGWITGLIKDAAVMPFELEPAVELSSSSKMHVAMDIKPGQSKSVETEVDELESEQLLQTDYSADNTLTPLYVASFKQ